MSSDLDDLFARIDEDPTLPHPGDIEKLITYYRQQRAAKEAGTFKKAKKEEGPKMVINLEALGLKPAVAAVGTKRRV
jgi:adenine/guanine phosphoribosyltransferase-like PRPP-binding protein